MTTAYDLFQKEAANNPQLFTLLRFACRCEHVTALTMNTFEPAVTFLAAKNATAKVYTLGEIEESKMAIFKEIASQQETKLSIEQLKRNDLDPTDLLYINTPAEGNYRAMELGKYAQFVNKFIVLPNTVAYGLKASDNIKLADNIQPIGLSFGINHFIQANDDWFILEHDDVDPGMTVLVNKRNVQNA